MASDAIIKYLEDTNRPYSCADVTVNLRGAYTKGVIQKTLDALSESGKIKCKLYGKQKVYAALQPDTAGRDNDIEDYDNKFKSLTQNLQNKTVALKTADTRLKSLVSTPTNDSAKSQIDDIKKINETLHKKLEILRTSTEVIGAEEKKAILDQHDQLLREYRKRKRICSDMLDAVLEGYPKSKKNLLEELCIETDEMINFKLMSA